MLLIETSLHIFSPHLPSLSWTIFTSPTTPRGVRRECLHCSPPKLLAQVLLLHHKIVWALLLGWFKPVWEDSSVDMTAIDLWHMIFVCTRNSLDSRHAKRSGADISCKSEWASVNLGTQRAWQWISIRRDQGSFFWGRFLAMFACWVRRMIFCNWADVSDCGRYNQLPFVRKGFLCCGN